MKYLILESDSAAELTTNVQQHLDHGWQLQGPPSVVAKPLSTTTSPAASMMFKRTPYHYVQAMFHTHQNPTTPASG